MSSLYDNLLKATDNTNDMVFSRYGKVTEIDGDTCTVEELDDELTHENISIPAIIPVKLNDTVLLGFVDNSIHQPYIQGTLSKDNPANDAIILALGVGLFKIKEDGHLYVELPQTVENYYEINSGHLIVTVPEDVPNDYTLDTETGHLYYDRGD